MNSVVHTINTLWGMASHDVGGERGVYGGHGQW